MIGKGFYLFAMLAGVSAVAATPATAETLKLATGQWDITDSLRNFSLSPDGTHEIDNGSSADGSGRCIAAADLQDRFHYLNQDNAYFAGVCKFTTLKETANLVDSVAECSGEAPSITHTVIIASDEKTFTTIIERTFTTPLANGGFSRSVIYRRGKWLRDSCDE